MPKLTGKIALVTGASQGIGGAVAKRYAQEGAQVVLVARSTRGLEATDDAIRAAGGKPAVLVPLDLRDFDKLDALGPNLLERFGRLDILVGNAAILGELSPLSHQEPKNWQAILDVNLTANWRLLRILDPLLQRAEAGRAIFVTSGVTQMTLPYWGPYSITKTALEMLVNTYAAEVAQTKVRANLIDPGVVRTAMRKAAMPGEDPQTLPAPEDITDLFVAMALPDWAENGVRKHV